MIALLQRKSLKFFHPLLKRAAKIYLSRPRNYTFKKIRVKVLPGVFHPGLFFSTKVLLEFIGGLDLEKKKVLELGAGTGLVSIFCAKEGAIVTASDINTTALKQLEIDALANSVSMMIKESDLFDSLAAVDFDVIVINPPYYPKDPTTMEDRAWYCGEEFDYFKRLFQQVESLNLNKTQICMILSEDCEFGTIKSLAEEKGLQLNEVYQKRIAGENNFIYKIDT